MELVKDVTSFGAWQVADGFSHIELAVIAADFWRGAPVKSGYMEDLARCLRPRITGSISALVRMSRILHPSSLRPTSLQSVCHVLLRWTTTTLRSNSSCIARTSKALPDCCMYKIDHPKLERGQSVPDVRWSMLNLQGPVIHVTSD